MFDKKQYYNAIAKQTVSEITRSPENWASFLSTMARNYEFDYPEQVMIYAQRPNATLCKSFDSWFQDKLRFVQRGSKGIALFDLTRDKPTLRYVFDVADTGERKNSLPLDELWTIKKENEYKLHDYLKEAFHVNGPNNLPIQIQLVSNVISGKYWEDYQNDFIDIVANSELAMYDRHNLEAIFKKTVANSVTYASLARCGYEPLDTIKFDDLKGILEFNNKETISALGTAVSELSTTLLKEIERANRLAEKEIERSYEHEQDHVYEQQRVSDSEYRDPGTDTGIREVRHDEKELFNEESTNDLQQHDSKRDIDPTSERSTEECITTIRTDDERVVEEITSSQQGTGSDGLGKTHEHAEKPSRRDDHEPTYQQLGLLEIFSEEEQIKYIDDAGYSGYPAFSMEQEQIDAFLIHGSNTEQGRMKIVSEFSKQHDEKALKEFVKETYHGGFGLQFGDKAISAWYAEDGIHFANNNGARHEYDVFIYPWEEAVNRIGELLQMGIFATNVEVEEAYHFEKKEVMELFSYIYHDLSDSPLNEHLFPSLRDLKSSYSADLMNLINDQEFYENLLDEYHEFLEVYHEHPEVMRFRYRYIDDVEKKLEELSIPRKTYPSEIMMHEPIDSFITDDEIDMDLATGSGFVNGRTRIYDYFKEKHPTKEKADFLKNEYGTGGHSHALSGARGSGQDHDAKGIKYTKLNCQDVRLSWNETARRIQNLIEREEYHKDKEEPVEEEPELEDVVEEQLQEGDILTLEGTDYKVTDVREDEVQMLDESLAYPVYRVEKKDVLNELQKEEPVLEEGKPAVHANNYHLTDRQIGEGGPKTKFENNIAAIRLLYQLEEENRNATEDEQDILAKYVGWGGLPDAFDADKDSWADEYKTLKNLLSEEEYEKARASTLTAHYTSPIIINTIYEGLENFGFRNGNILEPSMGIGHFFGMLPNDMRNSRLYGVELDEISGRISKKLYPNADITISGYEKTDEKDFYDVAIGNVPFGNYKVNDKAFNKYNFSIHNYFFAKALDQVRPGGIVAFVTSHYTMDSKNPDARRYIAQRAELLGAIRLPDMAFKKNAGAEVVTDIIFLQKRDHIIDIEPSWIHLDQTESGHVINSYFTENPQMIMGELQFKSTQYGKVESTVVLKDEDMLLFMLHDAVQDIRADYVQSDIQIEEKDTTGIIPADPRVKNYSYTEVDGEVYFRENSIMTLCSFNDKTKDRMKGMIQLREIVNDLIEYQMESYPDEDIKAKQAELNNAYDMFVEKHGLINDKANAKAFSEDSSYYLLCSLENLDEEGKLKSKADMFTKRTIRPEVNITSVDTPSEALAVSIGEKGKVDLNYMAELLGTSKDTDAIIDELQNVIFQDPLSEEWQTADEYLSGNVRDKLRIATMAAENNAFYNVNKEALEKALPKELDASQIDVRLGATWIDTEDINDFMRETFEPPFYLRRSIEVKYSNVTAEWRISQKNAVSSRDVAAYETYGTKRANAYRILEESLNLKDIRIYDTFEDTDGKKKRVLNKKETMLAQQKQQAIKDAFNEWIWRDPQRRDRLVKKYNELFNSTRPREFDGSHIRFIGMNPDIQLREHQKNAIAHVLYGGNTLLAHEVGAGKTFECIAAAMESKRLGLSQKALFVVPNHLTLQWANEFLTLYPSANLLVATKKDFEKANRKKFCARIATGDYDGIIIGHSQFERIPISAERQERLLNDQIEEIEQSLVELKVNAGENFSIKQMEKTKKSLETRLEKLLNEDKKDDVVTFEQLGVDRLFVDESQAYKNLFLYTKMRNVAGLSTSEAQKSSDMFMKCRYMDEITGGKGVVFATGTPVSNSMTELYTVMRYLQYGTLQQKRLNHFDCWASTFGETTTAIELAPEGTGYRARTRFAKFFNLPELMNMFKEVADIKTSDQLELPVPEAHFETVVVKPSEIQKEMVKSLSERAAKVHDGNVDPSVDNMLKITSDGRKIGLDQRLIDDMLPDDPSSKLNTCVENVFRIWEEGTDKKLTQLLFCDLSTPKSDGTFNVYDDIKQKLLDKGIPENEVAFIHDANSEAKKKELFSKVRTGDVRVLIGSTQKMGAGTNVQDRLVALHHLDVGWRPSDMTQRNGRIIRQGNQNKEVQIYQYVTEQTFDAYLYQTLENKQKFISQIMTSKSPVRSCDDVDEQALSYAEVKALCAGNPFIKEKMDLDIDVARLKMLKADHQSKQYRLENQLLKYFPQEIADMQSMINCLKKDIETVEEHPLVDGEFVGVQLRDRMYLDKEKAGEMILQMCKMYQGQDLMTIGTYRGFEMDLRYDFLSKSYAMDLKVNTRHTVYLGSDAKGNFIRMDNALAHIPSRLSNTETRLDNLFKQQQAAEIEIKKPFLQEQELNDKCRRLAELDIQLNIDEAIDIKEHEQEEKPSILESLKSNRKETGLSKQQRSEEVSL